MNIEQLKKDLTLDEGCINKIYLDHLRFPTLGIGHLITSKDEESGMPVGTEISEKRVFECFEKDIEIVCIELDRNMPWWKDLSEERQLVMANMCFNLGMTRLSKFKKFLKAMKEGKWEKASIEMMDSRWATQVGDRAVRLQKRVLTGD